MGSKHFAFKPALRQTRMHPCPWLLHPGSTNHFAGWRLTERITPAQYIERAKVIKQLCLIAKLLLALLEQPFHRLLQTAAELAVLAAQSCQGGLRMLVLQPLMPLLDVPVTLLLLLLPDGNQALFQSIQLLGFLLQLLRRVAHTLLQMLQALAGGQQGLALTA